MKFPDLESELDKVLQKDSIEKIYAQSLQSYPDESCGLILEDGIRPCTNILNDLHQADSKTYPRTAKEGFVFSAEDALFLSRNINSDNPVKIIYHSHPNVGAYFSNEDKSNALLYDEPIYPVDHLVIDVQSNEVICSKLFRFIEEDYELIAVLPGSKNIGDV
jgi:proteasome lid subunit RPN8/RPN11